MTYSIKAIDAISMRRVNKEKYYTGAITKKKKKRFYVLWYYIYINDQSYELNRIINKDVLWFFIRLVL